MDGTLLEKMRTELRGPVIGPDDEEYGRARTVYNAMIDKKPAAVVECRDTADVMAAVDFLRENGLELAVRGGGHSGPGLGLRDGAVTLDLSPCTVCGSIRPPRPPRPTGVPRWATWTTPPTHSAWPPRRASCRPPASAD